MNTAIKNLWGLNKAPEIKSLLIALQHETNPNAFALLDEERLSDQAVRIISPTTQNELSAYIYSYAQRQGYYGLDLEFPYLIETKADDQTVRLNELTMEEVIKFVIEHLEIQLDP